MLSAGDYAQLLMKLADEGKIKTDYYSNGGVVEELEAKFATLLAKESAVWMPTGTLANHIAIRHHAGDNRRVIVQEQSHIYQDTGDSAQSLSNLNLIPLAEDQLMFSLDDVREVVDKSAHGRVETHVGAISIESPVRRQNDRMVLYDQLKSITDFAQSNGIRTHLDGARIFIQGVHTNLPLTQYTALFDTVYVSMWKFFNAASGAILAGPKSFTEKLYHERRMFGGGLPAAWPFAAVALHYADTFVADYAAAWKKAGQLFFKLESTRQFDINSFENGSHIVRMDIPGIDLARFKQSLETNGIDLPKPDEKGFLLKVNISINAAGSDLLENLFLQALQDARK